MIKFIGTMCILISSSMIGIYFCKLQVKHIQVLKEFKKILQMLQSEVDYALTPLPLALENISLRISGQLKAFLECLVLEIQQKKGEQIFDIWERNVRKHLENYYFDLEDINLIISFGKNLGYLDKEMQKKNIYITLEYLEDKINTLDSRYKKNEKMYKSLGFISGMLIAIVLF